MWYFFAKAFNLLTFLNAHENITRSPLLKNWQKRICFEEKLCYIVKLFDEPKSQTVIKKFLSIFYFYEAPLLSDFACYFQLITHYTIEYYTTK